jgi:chromosome partitioning protein
MGTIIAIANQKGGVGKTTLAVHLGVYASRQGRRVLVVDGDPQGNATSWLLDGDVADAGLFRLLVVGDPAREVVRGVNGRFGVGLLPGNQRTGEAMVFLSATGKPFDTVARAIRPLAEYADFVLVDMPPSRAAGFQELLFAADWVIVPTQLERLSLEGVQFMAQAAQDLREGRGQGPRLLGIVPNMVRYTREHREQLDALVKAFGPAVWPPVPLSVRVAEACGYGQVLFDHAPREKVTKAMGLVGKRFLQNIIRD